MWTSTRKQLTARRLAAILAALALVRVGLAQEEAPKEPNWSTIRQTALQSIDRRTLELWVDFQIQQLLSNEDSKAVEKVGSEFYAKMVEQYKARNASKEFQDGLAKITSEAFIKHYQPSIAEAKPPRPLGVAMVLMVLRDFAHPVALPCFQAALSDPTPGPRFVAAEGLAAIRQKISDDNWTTLLPALQQAGIKESNPITQRALYRALFVQTTGRIDGAVQTLLAILERRLIACEHEDKLPEKADAEAAAWLAPRASRINNADTQNEITRQLARLLADAVDPYLNAQLDEGRLELLENVIRVVEAQLTAVVRSRVPNAEIPNPTVTATVLAGGENRDQKVNAALAQWIGTTEEAGLLNQNPFGLPRGLGIQRKPRPPTTAPVTE